MVYININFFFNEPVICFLKWYYTWLYLFHKNEKNFYLKRRIDFNLDLDIIECHSWVWIFNKDIFLFLSFRLSRLNIKLKLNKWILYLFFSSWDHYFSFLSNKLFFSKSIRQTCTVYNLNTKINLMLYFVL